MNKVVSIEIAGQVLWIEESAYDDLKRYLQTIRSQLGQDESAEDIYNDIELRVAELLYAIGGNQSKAILKPQLDSVIEQVGFIDDEDIDAELPRRSFRDPQNRIVGGVCAGLSVRWGVPAFIIRLAFIGLTAVFGLGLLLYLIFWPSLDSSGSRRTALAAQGKAQTAKTIASYEVPKTAPLVRLQRILFLPFSLVGTLLTLIGEHFQKRQRAYLQLFKHLVAIIVVIATTAFCTGLFEFTRSRLFSGPLTWLLSASVMYLLVLLLAIVARKLYVARPGFELARAVKWGALVPVLLIAAAAVYINLAHSQSYIEQTDKQIALTGTILNLAFNDSRPATGISHRATFQLRTGTSDQLLVQVSYSSDGSTDADARKNLQSIDYAYRFQGDTLYLDSYWTLRDGELSRGQNVDVVVEIPQDIQVSSSMPLRIDLDGRRYQYSPRNMGSEQATYLVRGPYLLEQDASGSHRLGYNERSILEHQFCEQFFIGEHWNCAANIQRPIATNSRFDRAFEDDAQVIESMRESLLPDRSLMTHNLTQMRDQMANLSARYPVTNELLAYLELLMHPAIDGDAADAGPAVIEDPG